jgi:hypothetical protein
MRARRAAAAKPSAYSTFGGIVSVCA